MNLNELRVEKIEKKVCAEIVNNIVRISSTAIHKRLAIEVACTDICRIIID